VGQEGAIDLEAAEFYVRTAVLALGASVLEQLLENVGVGRQTVARTCARNHLPRKMQSTGRRAKTIQSILGSVRFERTRLDCPECEHVEYPGDELLGVQGTGFSPGMRRLMTRAGARESFGEAASDLHAYAGIKVDPKSVEREAETVGRLIDDWMQCQASAALLGIKIEEPPDEEPRTFYVELDGTGVPMRKSEVEGRKGKGRDGRSTTREVKLGCVFTQTALDEKGRPVRDPGSTSFVGAIETSNDFGYRLKAEAVRRGMKDDVQTIVISDGAEYNATIAKEHFPNSLHILDLYHAKEHLSDFIKDNTNHSSGDAFHEQCKELMEQGQIEQLLEQMRQALPRSGPRRSLGFKQIAYFDNRKEQMRYAQFRAQGLFVGSGVIESSCKTVIGKRLKQAGMFWSVEGANAIIAARCCLYSKRFEQFWEDAAS